MDYGVKFLFFTLFSLGLSSSIQTMKRFVEKVTDSDQKTLVFKNITIKQEGEMLGVYRTPKDKSQAKELQKIEELPCSVDFLTKLVMVMSIQALLPWDVRHLIAQLVQVNTLDFSFEPFKQLRGNSSTAPSVYSPQGDFILTGSETNTVCLWETFTGKQIREFTGHTDSLQSLAFNCNGTMILSVSDDATLCFEARTGRKLLALVTEGKPPILAAAFSPTTDTILAGNYNGSIDVWSISEGEKILSRPESSKSSMSTTVGPDCTFVEYSPDGTLILARPSSGFVFVWDLKSENLLWKFKGDAGIIPVVFSPTSETVLTGSPDGTVSVRKSLTGEQVMALLSHEGEDIYMRASSIHQVLYSPDGKTILARSVGGAVYMWDTMTGTDLRVLKVEGNDDVFSVACSPDNSLVFTGSLRGRVCVWNLKTGKLMRELKKYESAIRSITCSPDGKTLLIQTEEKIELLAINLLRMLLT
ncbi:WD40 repeat domain-containing protein [Candidatus Dependentiae bacterium]|nr:WD40 repeat domain-containing protein [Candidatus Dependentiae bacterium]